MWIWENFAKVENPITSREPWCALNLGFFFMLRGAELGNLRMGEYVSLTGTTPERSPYISHIVKPINWGRMFTYAEYGRSGRVSGCNYG